VPAAVLGEAVLDVRVEGLAALQGGVPAEDGVGARCGELAALVGVTGLEDDRAALRGARDVELALDVEVLTRVDERTRLGVPQEDAVSEQTLH